MWQVDLLAIHKESGEPVVDEPFYTVSSPYFRSLTVVPEDRMIELSAYATRIRLVAVPLDDEEKPDGREPDVAN